MVEEPASWESSSSLLRQAATSQVVNSSSRTWDNCSSLLRVSQLRRPLANLTWARKTFPIWPRLKQALLRRLAVVNHPLPILLLKTHHWATLQCYSNQGGLQLMRLLSQSGDVQTQVPAPNGPGAGPMVHTMNHPVGPPMMTGHGAPIGYHGATMGQQSAPGQTGPAGPTPPLEEDRGATSASVLDFFAKASTQSSTSPHHQMIEASAFTSVPPPPLITGGPPSSLPAPRTLLPPAGPPAHQV